MTENKQKRLKWGKKGEKKNENGENGKIGVKNEKKKKKKRTGGEKERNRNRDCTSFFFSVGGLLIVTPPVWERQSWPSPIIERGPLIRVSSNRFLKSRNTQFISSAVSLSSQSFIKEVFRIWLTPELLKKGWSS
jgi:hypothetical protein